MMYVGKSGPDDFDEEDADFMHCGDCSKVVDLLWHIFLENSRAPDGIFMCTDCLRTLRARIDALAILVITGEDTDDNPIR